MLDIGELAATIESERHRTDFRKFLRNLDKTASAAPEIKGERMSEQGKAIFCLVRTGYVYHLL